LGKHGIMGQELLKMSDDIGGFKIPDELVEMIRKDVEFMDSGGIIQSEVWINRSTGIVERRVTRWINKDGEVIKMKEYGAD